MFKPFVLAALALSASTSSAQVGFSQWTSPSAPTITLTYPTEAASTPTAMGPFTLNVAVNARPAPGKRPLVVLSHGTGGNPLPDHDLATTLVRAGFVVAQPTHEGDNHLDTGRAGPESFRLRPLEVSQTLDALAADPEWGRRVDTTRVGVVAAAQDEVLVPRFHSQHLLTHCTGCTLLATLPGGHFDVLSPWPAPVAQEVAAKQVRGGALTPGFDAAARQAAHARIADFHRQHLLP